MIAPPPPPGLNRHRKNGPTLTKLSGSAHLMCKVYTGGTEKLRHGSPHVRGIIDGISPRTGITLCSVIVVSLLSP